MESQYLDILNLLESSFLFRGLELNQLQKLVQHSRIRTYKPGRVIIEEDVVNDKIALIIDGLVKIYKITSDGKENYLAIEKPSDYLGVMDLENNPATATIEAIKSTTILMLPKNQLTLLLEKNPLLWKKMYKILLAKLKMNIELLEIAKNGSLLERTSLTLDFLSRLSKNNVIHLSQESLANIIGATRPRVTEALHTLQKRNKIILSSKRIKLLA